MATALLEKYAELEQIVGMTLGTDRGKWWADTEFGSDLWLIRARGQVDEATDLDVFRRVCEEALTWMATDGLVDEISVAPERKDKNTISYVVTLLLPDGKTLYVEGEFNVLQ